VWPLRARGRSGCGVSAGAPSGRSGRKRT
jgi:hypothetical protein